MPALSDIEGIGPTYAAKLQEAGLQSTDDLLSAGGLILEWVEQANGVDRAAVTDTRVADHHSEYLARAVAALTPEGHRRVDELLDELAGLVGDRAWLAAFAKARRMEADSGELVTPQPSPPRC